MLKSVQQGISEMPRSTLLIWLIGPSLIVAAAGLSWLLYSSLSQAKVDSVSEAILSEVVSQCPAIRADVLKANSVITSARLDELLQAKCPQDEDDAADAGNAAKVTPQK